MQISGSTVQAVIAQLCKFELGKQSLEFIQLVLTMLFQLFIVVMNWILTSTLL